MKLGIFGGTFDPPHLAHLILASEAHYQLELDLVLWVLTRNPPHKGGISKASVDDRLNMLSSAIADNQAFEISRIEIDRPGPHFAADTMGMLVDQFTQAELFYLMGGDSLRDLPTWERPSEFLAACHAVGVMRRPGDNIDLSKLEAHLPGITQKVSIVETPLIEISGTLIRGYISEGKPFRYYLPDRVYKIVLKRGLYRS